MRSLIVAAIIISAIAGRVSVAAAAAADGESSCRANSSSLLFTRDGYDNFAGMNAICWSARAYPVSHEVKGKQGSEQEKMFSNGKDVAASVGELISGPATMLHECPYGVDAHLQPPIEKEQGVLLKTQRWYSFKLAATVNMTSIREQFGLSDAATFALPIAGRVVFCPPSGNLCSPFIVDQINYEPGASAVGSNGGSMANHEGHDSNSADSDEGHLLMDTNSTMAAHSGHSSASHSTPRDIWNRMTSPTHESQSTDVTNIAERDGKRFLQHNSSHLGGGESSNQEMTPKEHDAHAFHGEKTTAHDSFDLKAAKIIRSSSEWQFHEIHPDDDVILHMVFDAFIHEPGLYFPLGTIQLLVKDETENSTEYLKIDIANLLHSAELSFHEPPQIREVSSAIDLLIAIAVAIACIVQLILLFFTIRYRKEGVMQMSQGNFLILVQIAGLIAASGSILQKPENDLYCRVSSSLTFIPMQLMISIIFGRLLRIVTIMGGLMEWNKPQSKKETRRHLRRIPHIVYNSLKTKGTASSSSLSSDEEKADTKTIVKKVANRTHKLRRKFPATWLWFVIIMVTLPQVVLQIVGAVFYPRELNILLNDDESVGRYRCGTPEENLFSIGPMLYFFLTLVATLYQACKSRNLPALFNEACSVCLALLPTVGLVTVGFTLVIATSQPTSAPGVRYFVLVAIVLNFTLNVALRLVLPKLRLIWKGEKVVMSQMFRVNHKERPEQNFLPRFSGNTADLDEKDLAVETPRMRSASYCEISRRNSMLENKSKVCGISMDGFEFSQYTKNLDPESAQDKNDMVDTSMKLEEIESAGEKEEDNDLEKLHGSHISISNGYALPSDLTVNIVQLNRKVTAVNERILSGLIVSKEDWIDFRRQVDQTQSLLRGLEYD